MLCIGELFGCGCWVWGVLWIPGVGGFTICEFVLLLVLFGCFVGVYIGFCWVCLCTL